MRAWVLFSMMTLTNIEFFTNSLIIKQPIYQGQPPLIAPTCEYCKGNLLWLPLVYYRKGNYKDKIHLKLVELVDNVTNIGDVIEIIIDIPTRNLRAGTQGTIVHCHNEAAYEVELTNEEGETLDFLALTPEQFVVVWRAETQEWVSVAQKTAAIVGKLPEETANEILDFARFLSVMSHLKNGKVRSQTISLQQA
jgi:hypothetical protein